MVRSPVEICLGTSPSQAAKSRPLVNASPVPIAATIALEMIGPIPGTLTSYSIYYNESRTHLGLGKDAPLRRSVQRSGTIIVTPILSGLHHRYRADMIFGNDRYQRVPAERQAIVQRHIDQLRSGAIARTMLKV